MQPKPKYANIKNEELESQMIRASIDKRIPNEATKRSRCTACMTARSSRILDLRQGYHQLILDPAARQIATFSTPWGNYRPKRQVFGAKSSQDVFDEAMFRAFGDIPTT